jgi:Zn-dependent protease
MPEQTLFRFRVLGFAVSVRASFFFVSILLAMSGGGAQNTPIVVGSIAITFLSILWHELGHAFAARAFGANARIELLGSGGLTHHDVVAVWWQELLISLAGPAAGLLLGGIVWLAGSQWPPSGEKARWLLDCAIYINVGWTLLNLIPLLPYDGGQAFLAIAQRWTPHGAWIANGVSLLCGALGTAYAVVKGQMWLGYVAGISAIRAVREMRRLHHNARFDRAWDLWCDGEPVQAETILRALWDAEEDIAKQTHVVEVICWTFISRGEMDAARSWYAKLTPDQASPQLRLTLALLELDIETARVQVVDVEPDALSVWSIVAKGLATAQQLDMLERLVPSSLLSALPREPAFQVGATLFGAGRWAWSGRISRELFALHHIPTDAYNVACSESRLGNIDEALTWLHRAFDAGLSDLENFENDEDLAAVRGRFTHPLHISAPGN